MTRTLFLAVALAALSHALPSLAILTRADRDDAEYRELATRYPAAIALEAADGAGALIAPRWILTAANRAAVLARMRPAAKVLIAGRPHEVEAVFVHPDWQPGRDSDIALVFLRDSAVGVEPSPISRDTEESGETVYVTGFGETGRIGENRAAGRSDRLPRAAINTVDRVTPHTLQLRLKGPEDASDLQGALGAGDRGAPAFVEVGGRILVAGIASRIQGKNGDVAAGKLGDWEVFTRVSAFAAWIDEVMSKAALAEAARETAKPSR